MSDMKRKSPYGTTQESKSKNLQVWDVPYLTSEARNNWLNLDVSNITEYFSLGVCMEGLNMLYSRLFKVSLEIEESAPGEIWHPDVYKLAVRDLENNGSLMGYIYCDFFSREDKPLQVRVYQVFCINWDITTYKFFVLPYNACLFHNTCRIAILQYVVVV